MTYIVASASGTSPVCYIAGLTAGGLKRTVYQGHARECTAGEARLIKLLAERLTGERHQIQPA